MKIGYLGPRGTFSEQAALHYINGSDEGVMFSSIVDLLFAVEREQVDSGIVPIENSIEGTVTPTVDTLVFDVDLFIRSEFVLPVSLGLLAKEKANRFDKIISHPQPLGQCREFLYQHYPDAQLIEASSTAEAARLVQEGDGKTAAISSKHCGELYNLVTIYEDIQDRKLNATRFFEVSKKDTTTIFSNCKMSLVFSTSNRPGNLYQILNIFSLWDLNLTKIESRPMKNKLGEYVFFVDVEGKESIKDFEDALHMVKRKASFFKMLGAYSRFSYEGGE